MFVSGQAYEKLTGNQLIGTTHSVKERKRGNKRSQAEEQCPGGQQQSGGKDLWKRYTPSVWSE